MTDNNIDIEAVDAREDELIREYADAWRVYNDAIGALPADATLRDMGARRERAAELTLDAVAEQDRIAAALVENVGRAVEWAQGVLDSADESGLDGMTDEELRRVMDRAIQRGKPERALGAALLLEAAGDTTAMRLVASNYPEVGAALRCVEDYGDNPSAILDSPAVRSSAVRMPSDERIRPSVELTRQFEREDADRRAADEQRRLEDRQELQAELSRVPGAPTKLVSDEARSRVRRTPVRGGGRGGRGAIGR